MSFDTVIFKKSFDPLDSNYWQDVGFAKARNGRLVRNGDRTNMTVYQNGYGQKDWLMVQASLPKIVFGHNATLPSESQARDAASWLCEHVSSETGLEFTINDAKAFRIDYTRDYDIDEGRAHAITLALLGKDLPQFPRTKRQQDSVCFERDKDGKLAKVIAIYSKFIWANETNQLTEVVNASQGKLRLEVRLLRHGLSGIKGARKPLEYLSQSISDSLLNEAASMLELERIINARNIDFQDELIVHARGQGSLGRLGLPTFIELVRRYGEHFYLNPDFPYAKSTYYKRKGELERLGLWGYLVAASCTQPP